MAQQIEHIKWINGTNFMVDGFNFQNARCKNYFLTHFHSDHTTGMSSSEAAVAALHQMTFILYLCRQPSKSCHRSVLDLLLFHQDVIWMLSYTLLQIINIVNHSCHCTTFHFMDIWPEAQALTLAAASAPCCSIAYALLLYTWYSAIRLLVAYLSTYVILVGLNRSFSSGVVYCSPITATLLKKDMGLPAERVIPLPVDTPHVIDGVTVILMDANHCPGACMMLFKVPVKHSKPQV